METEPYKNFIERNIHILFDGISHKAISKDLFDPLSYFFLDQFCRGMYLASPGADPNRLVKVIACREPTEAEAHIILETGKSFEKLGNAVYNKFSEDGDNHTIFITAAEYMARKLGRTDYYPNVVDRIIGTDSKAS